MVNPDRTNGTNHVQVEQGFQSLLRFAFTDPAGSSHVRQTFWHGVDQVTTGQAQEQPDLERIEVEIVEAGGNGEVHG